LFQVGSISKPFAATLAMHLADQGLVDLDAPVIGYLPDLRLKDQTAAQVITARQLLEHTGGFWGDWFDDRGLGDDALEHFVAEYERLHQLTRPGELWAYNNCGYILLGRLCEVLTGQPYETAMRERVLDPLGLDHTFLSAHEAIAYPVAVGHNQVGHGEEPTIARQFLRPRARNAAGGVIASVDDVLAFARFHLDGAGQQPAILRDATRLDMQAPHVPAVASGEFWGLGWRVSGEGPARTVGHGGATNGFRANLTMVPEQRFALAVLTNSSSGSAAAHDLEAWALATFCDIVQPEPVFVALSNAQLERLAGRYEQPYNAIEVMPAGDGIVLRHFSNSPYSETAQPPRDDFAQPVSESEFVVTEGEFKDGRLRFLFDQDRVRFLQVGGRLHTPVVR
jgi:CubicO group peptidase (beta-lactamase class C family)